MQTNRAELNESLSLYNELMWFPENLDPWGLSTVDGLASLEFEIVRQAAMISYINDFWILMIIALLTIPLVLLLDRPRVAQ